MPHRPLDRRLSTAIEYITPGARVADIGTDHAYLPIALIEQGIASFAVAADINEGPIESARQNIREANSEDRIATLRTDGLVGIERYAPDHILIFGMGGELILRILSQAPWIRDSAITLVLQPMSRSHLLRAWLTQNGFHIFGETISLEDKYYRTVGARYTGVPEVYTPEELRLGKRALLRTSALEPGFLQHEIQVTEAVLRGKRRSETADCTEEEELLNIYKKRLETIT